MQVSATMPSVDMCDARACAYNLDRSCHALAVTIGDHVHPRCDTYFVDDSHRADGLDTAGVGACKVTDCRYNEDHLCVADAIRVAIVGGSPDCRTYVG